MMCTIVTPTKSYPIIIKSGLFEELEHFIPSSRRIALITDDHVAELYGNNLCDLLSKSGFAVHLFTFPKGEIYKTRATKETLEDQLFENHFGRDSCVVALGGGVVTDLAGYLAATYCRGLPLIMMPTTLLGMVDASIGGKTGVNLPYGKNLLGCIHQPEKILIDPFVLKSLPLKELKNGIVEILKHALLADPALFTYLDIHAEAILACDLPALEHVITASCQIKKEIVEQDENEHGKRRLLNCGHTIGHALEQVSHYVLAHGEAVAIGLLVESYIGVQLGLLKKSTLEQIHKLLIRYALPLKIPPALPLHSLLEVMIVDKKSSRGKPRFALIQDIGIPLSFNGDYCTQVENSLLLNALQWMYHDLCRH